MNHFTVANDEWKYILNGLAQAVISVSKREKKSLALMQLARRLCRAG